MYHPAACGADGYIEKMLGSVWVFEDKAAVEGGLRPEICPISTALG